MYDLVLGIENIHDVDVGIISVQTPLTSDGKPNLKFVLEAIKDFLSIAKKNSILIIESSLYVTATDDEIIPLIEQNGFNVPQDIGVCYFPERIDPINTEWEIENTPRVFSTTDKKTSEIVRGIYSQIIDAELTELSSIKTAEAVKSFENTFRLVNISFVNEFADVCNNLGINIHEVIKGAKTKPFGFLAFYPSAGAGGHCIPKDSTYLTFSAKKVGCALPIVEESIKTNLKIPLRVCDFIESKLNELNINNNRSVIVSGISYKENTEDCRESPGLKIASILKERGINVKIHDSIVENFPDEFEKIDSLDSLSNVNCICVVQFHDGVKSTIENIVKNGNVDLIVDCKGSLKIKSNSKTKIVKIN
jgi:UDP-N-acetyl-D-glucosamine dehydrogenase